MQLAKYCQRSMHPWLIRICDAGYNYENIYKVTLMSHTSTTLTLVAMFSLLCAQAVAAQTQQNDTLSINLDGGIAFQSSADLKDSEGSFSVNRWFASMGLNYAWNRRNSIGISFGGGGSTYDFDDLTEIGGGTPWKEIEETRISITGRFGFGDTGSIILIPTARYNGGKDSNTSDGRTYGLYAAAAWRISKDLTIGPGIGVFSRLEDGTRIFPILVIDWDISERWNLSTGRGLAASQGPGLTLSYALSQSWSLGIAGRYENVEFRLDENGPTPGGVGRDQSMPLVAMATWDPNPIVELSVLAGIELNGKLKLKNALGESVAESSYDPAPIFGATFKLRF
jgi:hypothetical protein